MTPTTRVLLPAIAAAGLLAATSPAAANDRDLRATTVPPASCEGNPSSWRNNREITVMGEQAVLPPGTEGPTSPQTVDQRYRCALPLNNVDLGGTTNDNDITSFTVIYLDADGAAAGSLVEVTL